MALESDTLRQLKGKIGRLGVFGGTFDPVHNGHLAVADAVREGMGLDAILFIPAAQPPHKKNYPVSPFAARMAMLELAIAGRPDFLVTSIEAERPEPSYSVDTLRQLHALWKGEVRLFFIIGLDAFVEIAGWKEYEELPRLADLVVLNRPSHSTEQMGRSIDRYYPAFRYRPREFFWQDPETGNRILPFRIKPMAVSSTLVRQESSRGRRVEGLVPVAVARYISGHTLYLGGNTEDRG
jgi:nicotinate-nucleotide adenylyltransferase